VAELVADRRLRVVIAEDNYLVREGTRRLLEDSGEVEVLAAVGTADELLDAVERLRPDVALTDIRMPPGHHMEGIDAAHAIRRDPLPALIHARGARTRTGAAGRARPRPRWSLRIAGPRA